MGRLGRNQGRRRTIGRYHRGGDPPPAFAGRCVVCPAAATPFVVEGSARTCGGTSLASRSARRGRAVDRARSEPYLYIYIYGFTRRFAVSTATRTPRPAVL